MARVFKMFDPTTHVRADAPVGEALIGVGIDHGTEAGARAHYRRNEPACVACRNAAQAANRERREAQ